MSHAFALRSADHERLAKGFLSGAAGGLAGSFVMGFVMQAMQKLGPNGKGPQSPRRKKRGVRDRLSTATRRQSSEEPTVRVAEAISETVAGRRIPRSQQPLAGQLVHYAYGTLMGGAYGAAVEVLPEATACKGTMFGTALWLGGDEVMLPSLGLTGWPHEVPMVQQAGTLAAHWVYGFVVELVRHNVRAAF